MIDIFLRHNKEQIYDDHKTVEKNSTSPSPSTFFA